MNQKTANIILRVFASIWAVISLVLIILIVDKGVEESRSVSYLMQAVVSMVCSSLLNVYMWKKK
ncbi:MAG: hypothetical protein J6A22_00125 [Bacteroidales bacterium]|nr:hypothetical protein [Bacteroidales bacterium]